MSASPRARLRLGVLASGRGSNLQALIDAGRDADFPAEVALVLSDRRGAHALARAAAAGIPHRRLNPREEGFYREMAEEVERCGIGLICCAGFMRILPPGFVERFRGRIINIHPALLPSFPGLRAQRQALDAGVRVSGCTVHFVDEGVDTGPIIAQAAVPVRPGDDERALSERILRYEHRLYPLAVRLIAEGRVRCAGGVVEYAADLSVDGEGFISPRLQAADPKG